MLFRWSALLRQGSLLHSSPLHDSDKVISSNKAIRGVPVIVETMQPLISDARLERLKGESHNGEDSSLLSPRWSHLKKKKKKQNNPCLLPISLFWHSMKSNAPFHMWA